MARVVDSSGFITSFEAEGGEARVSRPQPDAPLHVEIYRRGSATPTICQATLSLEAIEYLVHRAGLPRLPDLLNRYGDQGVPGVLKRQLLSYFRPEDFSGERLLDFGCGFGASTLGLARLLPETQILGIDLMSERIEIGQKIGDIEKLHNAQFLCSPTGDRLPEGIGEFEFVMLSAVYEHLLPSERRIVMPLLWSVMKPGAAIFINQTPHRYFPFEHHSTGLWFVNYMPDKMAHLVARKFAKHDPSKYDRHIQKSPDWETHLRGGIRGGTEAQILRDLTQGKKFEARIMQPRSECARDRADYWLARTDQRRYGFLKKTVANIFRVSDRLLGTVPSLNLDVVIRKETLPGPGN